MKYNLLFALFLATPFLGLCQKNNVTSKTAAQRPNILFLMVDDLRPELGCYGQKEVISPAIDQLAAEGLLFERAYCQQAICSPSRTSLLTGQRPDATKVYDLTTHFRNTIPDVVTLPQFFKQNGYHTEWWGKIFHSTLLDSISWTQQGDRLEPASNWKAYVLDESNKIAAKNRNNGPAYEKADVPDNAYPDGKISEKGIDALQRLAKSSQPFFLALGFYKPHLPFNAPAKYWDLYDENDITLPSRHEYPDRAPELAESDWGELRKYWQMPKEGKMDESMTKKLIHGYRACVSYTDAQIGKVLQELKRLHLDENTIVVLLGDHGWKLGEYGAWSKHTNFEIDTRVPLIIKVPKMKNPGIKTKSLVEFVDLYPTLGAMAGLELPGNLPGVPLSPLFQNPELELKAGAISQYPRGKLMGHSIRTNKFRYTRWQMRSNPSVVVATELYDMEKDPQSTVNVAGRPAYSGEIERLDLLLKKLKKVTPAAAASARK